MTRSALFIIGALLVLASAGTVSASSYDLSSLGADQGLLVINCNVNGASVYFDGEYQGNVQNGNYIAHIYVTGTPIREITIQAQGYDTWSGAMPYLHAGQYAEVNAVLTETTLAPVLGGDTATYTVYCNVDGASVYFNTDYKGSIYNGELVVPVYTTAAPYTTYQVTMNGYTPFTAQITDYPEKGGNVKLYASLTPSEMPTPSSPASIFTVFGGMILGLAALVYMKRE